MSEEAVKKAKKSIRYRWNRFIWRKCSQISSKAVKKMIRIILDADKEGYESEELIKEIES